jgi:hypothetical protein
MFSTPQTTGTRLAQQIRIGILASSLLLMLSGWLPAKAQVPTPDTSELPPVRLHLPLVAGGMELTKACPEISQNSYATQTVLSEPRDPDRPPLLDPDINLSIRGYTATVNLPNLINLGGDTDDDAPQLAYLFRPARVPELRTLYQVYEWDWGCRVGGCLGKPISSPEVSLVEMATANNEVLYPPARHANIGDDHIALVLYAEQFRLTFTYTRDDSPVHGYLVHVENFCVDPNLLALYRELHLAGRATLPALRREESIGTAQGEKVLIAVRDSGSFMDPRSGKDWWQDTVRARLAQQPVP